jgi:NADH-quinone oxidoreductase subunit N
MLLGAFAAIGQTNVKRLLAYSSIGHMGYALIGLAAGSEPGVRGIVLYMAIYMVTSIGMFACVLAMRRQGSSLEAISDLAGLSRRQPLLAAAIAIFMFSMAGIPPLAGFFGKFYVFMAAIEAKLYVLAVVGVLSSVVGAFYYLRLIKIMYFDEPQPAFDGMGSDIAVITGVTAVASVVFFLFLSPAVNRAAAAASSLFGA